VVLAETYLAAPLAAYLRQFPDVRLDLVLDDRLVDLVADGVDVAIRVSARLGPSTLVARRLADDRVVVVGAPAYLARAGRPQTPGELVNHHCLRYGLLRAADEWRFRDPGGRGSYAVPVESRFACGSGAVLRSAALAGMGLAVLPSFMVAAELATGRLEPVLEAHTFARLGVYAVYPPARPVPSKTRAFVDVLAAAFRPAPWR
jgi:DNA-binding transcriptional LysR family regulator